MCIINVDEYYTKNIQIKYDEWGYCQTITSVLQDKNIKLYN